MLLAALAVVCAAAALLAASSAGAETAPLTVWETTRDKDAPAEPYVALVHTAAEVVQAKSERPVASCIWASHVIMECSVRDASDFAMNQRPAADAALDGPTGAASPLLESMPDGTCVPLEARALTCTRGGSGSSSGGRTYYKGNAQYECESQAGGVYSTNHHFPRVVYNSMRFCWAMQGAIKSMTRDNRNDCPATCDGFGGPDGSLVWRSFSARYRKNYCYNYGRGSMVRCAYDWVR